MLKFLIAMLILLSSFTGDWVQIASAQTSAATRLAFVESVRLSVVQKTGIPDKALGLKVTGTAVTVTREDNPAGKTTHEGRTVEATAIAEAISNAVISNPDYAKILSINIRYRVRRGTSIDHRTIDRLEFRRGRVGVFEIHLT